jgi:transposase-like protein
METENKNQNSRRSQRDYSLAFRMMVVNEVERGKITYRDAQVKYGIQGSTTVLVWLRKHGNLDWQNPEPMAGKRTPNKEMQDLRLKIKRLEAEKYILNLAIDTADELLNTDIRKKFLPLSVEKHRQQQGLKEELDQPEVSPET